MENKEIVNDICKFLNFEKPLYIKIKNLYTIFSFSIILFLSLISTFIISIIINIKLLLLISILFIITFILFSWIIIPIFKKISNLILNKKIDFLRYRNCNNELLIFNLLKNNKNSLLRVRRYDIHAAKTYHTYLEFVSEIQGISETEKMPSPTQRIFDDIYIDLIIFEYEKSIILNLDNLGIKYHNIINLLYYDIIEKVPYFREKPDIFEKTGEPLEIMLYRLIHNN